MPKTNDGAMKKQYESIAKKNGIKLSKKLSKKSTKK